MAETRPTKTSFATGNDPYDENSPINTIFPYREAVGALLYLSCKTRPSSTGQQSNNSSSNSSWLSSSSSTTTTSTSTSRSPSIVLNQNPGEAKIVPSSPIPIVSNESDDWTSIIG
ncbi:hypothetical protein DERF_009157 [Dermatophagoides farinae]|uniref:Uncharacterized protein n=1 Tax=Dermatophagoides farinae TaxID=6954 RepID=A0A922L3R2_DERFA|nr:hypothetical protein DERF_009157 [Dermatophagoides farinae]